MAEEHLAGDLGVDGVGVVEQRGGEEGEGGIEEEPEGEEDEAVFARARGWCFGARGSGYMGSFDPTSDDGTGWDGAPAYD